VLALSPDIVPIPGTKRVKYLEENAAAADLELTQSEIETLTAIQPPVGSRYPEAMAGFLKR
jgi:aryl-alcohol dehydrogenase-like predicted oxidoreductase